MEHLWVIFVVIYAVLKSSRDCMKKASLKRSSLYEVLFFYTLIGLCLALPSLGEALRLSPKFIFFILIKSAVVCLAWFFSCLALGKMSVSLYGIMDLARVVFSMVLGVLALGESLTVPKVIGALLVIIGLLMVNLKKKGSAEKTSLSVVIYSLLCCFFNSVSGTMDKALMKDGQMTSGQLQFWFMFFMTIIYAVTLIVHRKEICIKALKKNYWIPLMSLSLVLGDRLLFEANASPLSEVTVMTTIKQSSVIVTVLLGWWIYKEKDIPYKLFCCLIVLSGIFTSVFG
ncbi:MAG: DMT family transporter [Ruminococcaceae bacterium]|nr:DMT family transporter [Oscillospiraceae bacterium]